MILLCDIPDELFLHLYKMYTIITINTATRMTRRIITTVRNVVSDKQFAAHKK